MKVFRFVRFEWNDKASFYQCDEHGNEALVATTCVQRYYLRFGHLTDLIVDQWMSGLTQDEFDRFILSMKLEGI